MRDIKYWLWPLLYIGYVVSCYLYSWDVWRVSLLTVLLALIAFLGIKRIDRSLFLFLKPKEGKQANGFQAYWSIIRLFNDSTELMAVFLLFPLLYFGALFATELSGGVPVAGHIPREVVLTIIGIMTAAHVAMSDILSSIHWIEKKIGKYPTLFVLSILASLTGEPANAAIQNKYLKERIKPKHHNRVGVGLAASIGSGGGLTFFSPPAILIIWGTMSTVFGWSLSVLLGGIGLIVIAHTIACMRVYAPYIQKPTKSDQKEAKNAQNPLLSRGFIIFVLVVLGHILIAMPWSETVSYVLKKIVFAGDVILGVYTLGLALGNQQGKIFSLTRFEHDIEPLLIGALLVAVEYIGELALPGIKFVALQLPLDMIPIAYLPIVLALAMYVITGVVSALADNALATKVFIAVPIAIAATIADQSQAIIVANAGAIGVIAGALTMGWMTIQGNLPNFPIAKQFDIDPVERLAEIKRYRWTLIVAVVCMVFTIVFILPHLPVSFQA